MTTPEPVDGDNPTDRGNWSVGHPRELVATFLLPCPDPLPLPDGLVVPTYHPLESAVIQMLGGDLDEFYLRSLDGPVAVPATAMMEAPRGEEGTDASTDQPVLNWSNKNVLITSIQIHRTFSDAGLRVGLEPAMQLAEVVGGAQLSADERAGAIAAAAASASTSPISELRELGFGAVTIAECYVGLRVAGDIPDLTSPLVHDYDDSRPFGPVESDGIYPDNNAMWQWRFFNEGKSPPADLVEQRLRKALDIALSNLRSIQRASQALRRTPTSLSTLQRLPFVVPVLLRVAHEVGDASAPSWTGLLATRPDLGAELEPELLDGSSMAAFTRTRERIENGAFSAHVDLHRDGQYALQRSGDYRLAVLLFGIAAESLLDELMLHLMWEEAKTPEEVAARWFDGLDRRVREELPHRLGGPWDMTKRNPVGAWAQDVAALRHRVAHAGYTPTEDEAHASFHAVNALVTNLCDRLASQKNMRTYPRTAIALAGEGGLRRRNAYTAKIRRLERDRKEVPWTDTFTRWREAWRRLRQDQTTAPRTPDFDHAWLLAVRHPDRSMRWVKHDRAQHLAVEAEVASNQIPDGLITSVHDFADMLQSRGQTLPTSTSFEHHLAAAPLPDAKWVEDYHLVPMAGVMVDGSDFTQPQTTGIPA